jgi:hypothetical protein
MVNKKQEENSVVDEVQVIHETEIIPVEDEIIHKVIEKVEDNSAKVEAIVDELVDEYCHQLDDLIYKFRECLQDTKNPITEWELDDVCLKLPSYLYFIGEAQERFGIKEDIAKSVKMELYNSIHQRTRGTIADKQAASEAGTIQEDIVHKAYQRAYKRTKQKLEAAYEILSSVKKVISRRMGEQELSNVDSGKFRKA